MQNRAFTKRIKKKRRTENCFEQRTRTITFEPIERHKYSEIIVRLSTLLYTRVDCGFRQVVKILKVINETFDGLLGKIPNRNTIEIWVKKCGLNVYESAGKSLKDTDYAAIVDESMMIGSEKLLFTIGVPAKHQERPLNCADVNVLDMAVDNSWNGVDIKNHLIKASEKVGHNPLYVISDNASVMNKGVRCAKMNHQHDISHSLGMYLRRAYDKRVDFNKYVKSMAQANVKHNMKEIAYLLPPTQRTISRFMNLSSWVKWSSKMLDIYHTLKKGEKEVFSFIPANASLIDELSEVVKCMENIESICKNKGFSKTTVLECQNVIHKQLLCGDMQMVKLGENIVEFLKKEIILVGSKVTVHNNSSDIIESLFGKYKSRKSPNKLYGITSHILFMPIYTKLKDEKKARNFNFKAALEEEQIGKINTWAKENLTPNLVQARIKRLQEAG